MLSAIVLLDTVGLKLGSKPNLVSLKQEILNERLPNKAIVEGLFISKILENQIFRLLADVCIL